MDFICPQQLKPYFFTTYAIANIDHNSSSPTSAKTSSISLFQLDVKSTMNTVKLNTNVSLNLRPGEYYTTILPAKYCKPEYPV